MKKTSKKTAPRAAKDHYLMVRVDDDARELWRQGADAAGEESLSAWARKVLTREANRAIEKAAR